MKFLPMTRAMMAGALLLAPSLAGADVIYETAYVPTSSVLLPTSTVLSTSYVTPTSYTSYLTPTVSNSYLTPTSTILSPDEVLFPLSYASTYRTARRPRRYVERTSYYVAPRYALAPTSYVLPTSYVTPTSYVLPTSYVSSSIIPTSYVSSSIIPTTYLLDSSLVATSASTTSECGTLATTPMPTARTVPPPATTSAPANERRPSAVMESSPSNVDNEPSPVNPPVPPAATRAPNRETKPAPSPSDTPASAPETTPLDSGVTPPPAPVIPAPGTIQSPGDLPQADVQGSGTQTRDAYRPVYSTPSNGEIRPSNRARNILRGRVVSYDNGKAEEGVSVFLTSRTGAFSERTTMTDADGHFAVTLPDGDWAVKVRMPSGNVMTVGREDVTASAGRIMDSAGRAVQEFVITR